jgi:hypothetical protein
MTDDDRLRELDRTLAAALDVTPSPDLLPRIRERLAGEEAAPWLGMGLGMRLAAAFACGALAIGSALVFYAPTEESGGSAGVAERNPPYGPRSSGGAAGVAERNPPYVRRPGLALQTRQPPADVVGATHASPETGAPPDALRPSSDLAAIERFMAVATFDEPLVYAATLEEPPRVQIQVAELSIAPLEVVPLTPDE